MELELLTKSEFNYKQPNFVDVVIDSGGNITITYFKSNFANANIEMTNTNTDADYTQISTIAFPLSDISAVGHSYAIYFDNMGNLTKPIDNTKYIANSRDGFGLLKVLFGINDSNPIIYLNSYNEKACVLCYPPIRNANVTFAVRERNELPSEVWADIFGEDFSIRMNGAKARKKLLAEADPNNSLSYIEAQLDILTEVVFSMYDHCTDEQQAAVRKAVPIFDEFRSLLGSYSILTIKSADKCLDELSTVKAQIRKYQLDYYKAKAAI